MHKYSLVIIFILFWVLAPQYSFALKQAVFPSSQSLQPLPSDVHANISGNTNSSTVDPSLERPRVTTDTESEIQPVDSTSAPTPEARGMLLWPAIIVLCIIGFFVYRVTKNNNTLS